MRRTLQDKEVLGPVTYRLTLPTQWKIHDVFHACLLSPFKETELHGTNETRPPPDLVQGNKEYKVGAILTHHTYRNHETRYLSGKVTTPARTLGNQSQISQMQKRS